jgi:hypothetical protein
MFPTARTAFLFLQISKIHSFVLLIKEIAEGNEYGAVVESYWEGKTKLFAEKPPAAPLYIPQIIDKLAKIKTKTNEKSDRRYHFYKRILTALLAHGVPACPSPKCKPEPR